MFVRRLACLAVAGLWLGLGADLACAESVTAIPAPAARFGALPSCRVVQPNFEPGGHAAPGRQEVRFLGGARVFGLVAAPCRRAAASLDV